ncbi:hypothetical protein AWZ03_000576 [Drosophila navojoa]|uniref:Uncharacterized protein n=1 Tax=Drosophila navojoa TaxID=7232 RepID=A0A484BWE6_DRONA|nr:hypothetical protein AWZ03_000576 [Drosophila navojoa]
MCPVRIDSQLGTHESAGLRNECVVAVAVVVVVAVAEAMAVGEHSPVDDGVSTDACYLDPRRIEVQLWTTAPLGWGSGQCNVVSMHVESSDERRVVSGERRATSSDCG